MRWTDEPTRHLFFTGKGGVGKTSIACATAVALADSGKSVLLVSTDPASNLAHVFGETIGGDEPTAIASVPNLWALDVDPEAAAAAYRDRILGPVRGVLPEKALRKVEEELSGACTTEIAAFDEFTGLLTDADRTSRFDVVVFDTAPTGHTLRLLKLPGAWSGFLATNQNGASCLGPLAGLEKQRQRYADAVGALSDAQKTTLVLVSRPERSALEEAERTRAELDAVGVRNQRLIVNGLLPAGDHPDPLAAAMLRRQTDAVDNMPAGLADLARDEIALQPRNLVGVDALRALVGQDDDESGIGEPSHPLTTPDVPTLSEMVDQIAADGHGMVMVMGKGGVGKTTIAAAVAVELASRGHDVHLTTTDPAAHLARTVADELDHLQVSRIDPEAETERYRRHIMETKGADLDEHGRALLEEDLRSPCTQEIAIFQAFSRVIGEARQRFVVVDTAPTGHTLLLLDATGAYHREVTRHANPNVKMTTPLMRLQDPQQTKMLLVTLAETTPVLEAAALQEDLRRAGIEPWGWVINGSLAAAGPTDPLLVRRAESELEQIAKVQGELASRTALVPWLSEEPVGGQCLRSLVAGHAAIKPS